MHWPPCCDELLILLRRHSSWSISHHSARVAERRHPDWGSRADGVSYQLLLDEPDPGLVHLDVLPVVDPEVRRPLDDQIADNDLNADASRIAMQLHM